LEDKKLNEKTPGKTMELSDFSNINKNNEPKLDL